MNNNPTILIIGGVAGGASAAARARRLNESARIIMLERGPDVSFANCGLPYHIGGEIADRERLAVQTPESLRELLAIEVETLTEATAIDRAKKEVSVRRLADGSTDTIAYDKLILAPGASPIVPPLEGIQDDKIVTLRNLQDMDRIKAAAAEVDSVLVIGAGFIGLEMAEQLKHIGKQVSVVELQEQVLPQVDPEIAAPIAAELRSNGIELVLQDGVAGFKREGNQITATLNSGQSLTAGLVILSIGVKPESGLAKDAGLELGARGHISVNPFQQTSDPDIYAVGDVCETADPILGERAAIPLGGPANRQGRTAADHIFQGDKALEYPGSLGTAIVRVFDLALGSTGHNERRLQAAGVDYGHVTINAHQHAGYFPGAQNLTLKLLWDKKDGRVLGASAVGADGVDKRLDVIATAIVGKLTIDDLCHVELSYAPPFGSAKDPVNLAAFAACNIRDGLTDVVYEFPTDEDTQLIDVRPADLAQIRPIPGAVSIPLEQIRSRLGEIDKSRPVVTVCALGKMSYFATRILKQNGFNAASVVGGLALVPAPGKDATPTPQPTTSTPAPQTMTTPTSAPTKLDCTGLACPGPIMRVKEAASKLAPGDSLEISASDGGFANDLPAFCEANQYEFLGARKEGGVIIGGLRKPEAGSALATATPTGGAINNDATLVVFSQEMDKALAALVIANGALAMGGKATLFFTFWGLNALRKHEAPPIKDKTFMDKMFGTMLPQGIHRLPLSNMNYMGMGAKMMKDRMASKDLPNLEGLLADAKKGGARLVACAMSMEAMGIRQEELIDGVEIGGVAEFLGASGKAGTNLFI
ncbi:FAD-dependent oxidoreductase [Sulfuriroseicoccus oceanibius]|uniref:FAD-dependent oxidoreductase n=1 Tax=Sulfuriroseicoccus oceanibius TaxID=2707525 RepID=A0A6B3L9Q3_9BACT|nr:FAD-dependent oxidoreductase [Sulfuriroseicoccus oceanibius]QQL44119.1 FAD-dependent oxidoreductase [Sulfuriroseicoccus oceanibius]